MKSVVKYVFLKHALPAAICAVMPFCFVFFLVPGKDNLFSGYPFSEILLADEFLKFFLVFLRGLLGIFFVCVLTLGMSEAIRPGVSIGMSLVKGEDLNCPQFRNQLERFVVFVAEIYIAILGLLVTGFVDITLNN
jgi:hypothetical protein